MSAPTRTAADRDYDALRPTAEPAADSLEMLQEARSTPRDDLAEIDFVDGFQLPSAELLDEEELTVPVVPIGPQEFRCAGCFLVLHQRLAAASRHGAWVCRDCT